MAVSALRAFESCLSKMDKVDALCPNSVESPQRHNVPNLNTDQMSPK